MNIMVCVDIATGAATLSIINYLDRSVFFCVYMISVSFICAAALRSARSQLGDDMSEIRRWRTMLRKAEI